MAIDTTKKIKQVTYNGTEIPLSGYDTSDATVTAGDMSYGVVAYGASGKVTGDVTTYLKGNTNTFNFCNLQTEDNELQLSQDIIFDGLYRRGAKVILGTPLTSLGNATVADVAKGKTFTSAAGLKVTGTAEGSAAADVTFDLYNTGFNNLSVVYMSKIDGVMEIIIPQSNYMTITTIEGSMVAVVNRDFNGDTIDLIPDNEAHIAQGWRTVNVTLFIAGAETNGMIIDAEIA